VVVDFAGIRQSINGDSRSEAMHTKFDFMTLISETHLTNVACGGMRDKNMEAVILETEFFTLVQQPGTIISVHKKEFECRSIL